jgi:hypothetical protein
MLRSIGYPKVLLKDFVEKIVFKLIQEFLFEKKINQEKIEFLPTNKGLTMKRWKFYYKV